MYENIFSILKCYYKFIKASRPHSIHPNTLRWTKNTRWTPTHSKRAKISVLICPIRAEVEIAVGHFPTNIPHLAKQIQFARPNLLYISNGETIDSLLQYSCFLRNGRPISNSYLKLC